MALKILHSADWQIGQKAKHVAAVADTVRRARLDAAREVVQAANREKVDALVLAGDQFEDNLVEDRLVRAVVEILATSRAPVFVLPGNHDALTHDSVYRRASWQEAPASIFLFTDSNPIALSGTDAFLFPAPVFQKKSRVDPTAVFPGTEGGREGIRIGVAHGSLRIEGRYSEDDFPIALDAPHRMRVDYLALGHWHGHFAYEGRAVYSGTHETCNFGEKNSGQALLVEIAHPGATPQITPVPTGRLKWLNEELDFDLGEEAGVSVLRKALETIVDPSRTLLRIHTRGRASLEAPVLLRALEEELSLRFLHVSVEREDVASSVIDGKLADLKNRYPIVESLLDGITSKGLPPEESGAAMQLLYEILAEERA